MGSHVIFILKKENAGDDDFNQMDIPSFRAESDHTYHQKELVAVHRDSSHSSLDSNILVWSNGIFGSLYFLPIYIALYFFI